jgi:REP element-mobilizing transposase RayT
MCAVSFQKRIPQRLPSEDYLGPLAAHVTIVTRERRPLFQNDELASLCLAAMEGSVSAYRTQLHAYCLMPDHVHLLIELPAGVSLEKVVHHFKTVSGFALKRATGEPAWQTSYYDHILRREEALEDVAAYIWGNPVAQGIVENAEDYRWSGPREAIVQA